MNPFSFALAGFFSVFWRSAPSIPQSIFPRLYFRPRAVRFGARGLPFFLFFSHWQSPPAGQLSRPFALLEMGIFSVDVGAVLPLVR
jgi:hypothetical protein